MDGKYMDLVREYLEKALDYINDAEENGDPNGAKAYQAGKFIGYALKHFKDVQGEYGDGKPKPAGTWDFYGDCAPGNSPYWSTCATFSLGVFQWVAKSRGGTKRGRVVKRIKGFSSRWETTIHKATEYVEELNGKK